MSGQSKRTDGKSFKSICHNSDARMFSNKKLVVGEIYDVYLAPYPFSEQYEIFKDDEYYTSFMVENNKLVNHFYNQSQMISLNRENRLESLNIKNNE